MSWYTQLRASGRPNAIGLHEQLCWMCACGSAECTWVRKLQPIPGWDAEVDTIDNQRHGAGPSYTFRIYDCPNFKELKRCQK